MNTTTDTDEERDAIYGYLKLNNFILGLKDIFVRMIILTKKKRGKKKEKKTVNRIIKKNKHPFVANVYLYYLK